ncbi:MAG: XrtN system VIT domain-containing protein [Leptospiraceae bacterium]|nr:XrtN system VIT domain-containing protein [Leptospiraceae bacterium]
MKKIKEYFTKQINILGFTKSRYIWFLFWVITSIATGTLLLLITKFISSFQTQFLTYWAFGFGGIFFLVLLFILFKIFLEDKLRGYLLLTIIFSAAAFIVEKYVLNGEIFSPFTDRTVILLWVSFTALFISIFYEKISKWILLFFPPILLTGFFISFCFTLIMLPFMLFSWIAVLFLGLGILPYTPLMASIAFLVTCYRIFSELRENKYYLQYTFSKYLTYSVLIFASLYFIWFHTEWDKGQFIIRNHFLETKLINPKRSLIDDDLPAWASLGMKLPVNHVSELYLQPESNNRDFLFSAFGSDKLFDPFAFIVGNISKKADILNEDREHLLKLLFGYTHISLNRLWNGNSLITTNVDTYIQFYPNTRVSYTEMKISIYNESDLGNQEAIYTFKLPNGGVCTKLNLWIDNKEEPARLTYLSKAKETYDKIVGVERRDPSYVTWMEDNLLRVKVFPVNAKSYRTFKIGFINPLIVQNKNLTYQSLQIEGPPHTSAKHTIKLDVLENPEVNISGYGYSFEKEILPKNQTSLSKWFAYGKFKDNWKVYLDKPNSLNGEFNFSNLKLKVTELELQKKKFYPEKIYLLINSSLPKKEWKNVYSKLAAANLNSQIILVTNEWFYSKNTKENLDFIEDQSLPKFNLFPFYKITNETDILIITNREEHSIPFSDLKGSAFYNKNKEFFSKNKKPIYVQSLNGKLSTYFNSLLEYELIREIPISLDQILENISSAKITIPVQTELKYSFPDSEFTIELSKEQTINNKTGNHILGRLLIYKKIMRSLGKQMKTTEKNSKDDGLFDLAELGMVVTPFTSLLVLETANDYKRFQINKNKIGLGESNLQIDENASSIKHGNVPEPEEWIIFIICISFWMIWRKTKLRRA